MVIKTLTNIRDFFTELKHSIALHVFLIFITLWTRFVFLGYSDYQGDEIKALFRPLPTQTTWNFLLEQKKGPLQFLITALMQPFSNDYLNNFVVRLPFAIAGVLAVFYFYKLINLHFGRKIALYSSIFFSLNGFLIAFSRIVQYQVFTILLSTIALYLFSKALFDETWKFKGWYFGAFYWALAALAHYDAIFVSPFVIYIFVAWFKKYSHIPLQKRIFTIFTAASITLGILALFFVPYLLSLGQVQVSYWMNRIEGDNGKISDSLQLFRVYNPLYVYIVYLGLIGLSFFNIRKNWVIFAWVLVPLYFMEFFVSIPGTHIYTYLIPLCVLCAFGLHTAESLALQTFPIINTKKIFDIFLAIFFLWLFLLMHTVFIDHTTEYPWNHKKFLMWEMVRPDTSYNLSLFGFPYYRHWEEIAIYLKQAGVVRVSSNERKPITRFYLNDFIRDGDRADAFIYIYNPQSFNYMIDKDKSYYWVHVKKYLPDYVINDGDVKRAKIYNMPAGNLDKLKFLGY
ncbi:glycosyltransferase family 39 protein [candidate division WWE3 bacterium]|nr:glycosyltransferase family 39 protein [candidate division WWE3 bacterium]